MAKFLKWIAGGLGWVAGGPIGAIIGYAIGALIEGVGESEVEYKKQTGRFERPQTTQDGFYMTLLILSASVMKADGKMLKSELDYIKRFLIRQFGQVEAEKQVKLLQQILTQKYEISKVCFQIRYYMEYQSRLQLMHYLFGIANSDRQISYNELNIITQIAQYIGITTKDFESIKAMFSIESESPKNIENAYTILEITPQATEDEIKKAYRKMALKYHPDKVAHLGESVQNAAKEKFQKLQLAYEQIKKERNIK